MASDYSSLMEELDRNLRKADWFSDGWGPPCGGFVTRRPRPDYISAVKDDSERIRPRVQLAWQGNPYK